MAGGAVNALEWFADINRQADRVKLGWVVAILLTFAVAMLVLAVADRVSGEARGIELHGNIANARAGKPRPSFTFGHVTTMRAPLAGTWSRLAITSI